MKKTLLPILFGCLMAVGAQAQNLVTNPGFEDTPVSTFTVVEGSTKVLRRTANSFFDVVTQTANPTSTAEPITAGMWVLKSSSTTVVRGLLKTTGFHSGAACLDLYIKAGTASTGFNSATSPRCVNFQKLATGLSNTKKYVASVWAKKDALGNNQCTALSFYIIDNTAKVLMLSNVTLTGGGTAWTEYQSTFDLPAWISTHSTADFSTAYFGIGITTKYDTQSTPKTLNSGILLDDISLVEMLTTPTVGTATAFTSSGFTANWTAVANASSYDVQVYQGASLISTTNFSGQATTSGAITGLNSLTTYTYKVVAKGDGVNYSDSDPSTASANITTTVYTENFATATVSGNLEGYDGWAMSTNASWQAGASPLIGATPLVYAGYPGSNIGHVAVTSTVNNPRASVKLTTISAPTDGTTLYASFLVKVDNQNSELTGLREIFTLNQSLGEYSRCRVSAEHFPADNTVKFAVGKVSTKSSPSIAFSDANTHLLVLKYDKIAGDTNDKISLYINPDLTLTESEQANAIIDFEDATQTDWATGDVHLLIRQTGIGAKIGGIRVGRTWSDVIPAPATTNINGSVSASKYNLNASSHLNVANGATLTIDANTTVNTITVAPGAKVTLADTKTLSGTLTLQSDENGTATFVDNYDAPTVTATVQQHVTAGRNWYMSAPLSAANATVLNRGASVVEYDEETGLWPNPSTLTPGKGYIQVATSTEGSTGAVEFTGTTNSGNIPVTLTYHSGTGNGFNLVGNPYPSYLDWSAVATDPINTNVTTGAKMPTGTMWYRTISYNGNNAWLPNHAYNTLNEIVYNGTRFYKVTAPGTSAATGGPSGTTTSVDNTVTWAYEGSIYIFATVNASGVPTPATVSNLVPPMQAFWVKSTGGTLTFKNNMRSHKTDVGSNLLKAPKSAASEMPLVRLSVTNGVSADEAVIYATTNASNAFDSYDAPKYFNTASYNQPEIFTQVGTEKLAINALTELSEGMELPLGFATAKGNNFSIAATELKNLGSNWQVILKDKQSNNAEFNLTNGQAYNFSSSAVNDANRFSLIFRAPGVTTALETANKTNTQVFVNAANQITIIAPENSKYAVYNAVGQLMENGYTTAKLQTANYKLQTGIYVVKVNNQTTRVIIK